MTSQELSTRYQGVQKDSAGYKLLKGMGWKEGEGLGASKQGIKEHIRVKKKFENWGVGAVETHDRARDWSNGMSEFHRVLSTLSEITSKHAGSSGTDDASDDESDAKKNLSKMKSTKKKKKKEKGKREGKKKRSKDDRIEENKARKKKKSVEKEIPDTPLEEEIDPPLVKKATHIGRFKKRETSKMVKGYSSSDLAAILGEDPFAKQNLSQIQVEKEASEPSSSTLTAGSEDVDITEAASPQVTHAWWSNYFIIGPRAGSKGEKRRIKKKSIGFSEKDQENLYSSAHDNATTGRVGLGRSSMPKKVAGVRWSGTKTRLGSDDDADSESNQSEEDEEEGQEEDVEITIVMPSSKTHAKNTEKRLDTVIKAALAKEKNNCMKLKSLIKHVVKVIGGTCEKNHVSGFLESNTHAFKISQDSKKKTIVSLLSVHTT